MKNSCAIFATAVAMYLVLGAAPFAATALGEDDEETDAGPAQESGSPAVDLGGSGNSDHQTLANRRYLELSLFSYEVMRGRVSFKSTTGNNFKNEEERDFYGLEDNDALTLGFYGKQGFLQVGIAGASNYDLTVGVHDGKGIEAGVELDYTHEEQRTETVQSGGRTTAKSETQMLALGAVFAKSQRVGIATAKASARIGLTTLSGSVNDQDTADSLGYYFGFEGEYARPLRAFGTNMEQVYGAAYRYVTADDKESQDFAPLTGKAASVSHNLTFKLFGIRVHF